jgi:4-alpha-glucanotransferase
MILEEKRACGILHHLTSLPSAAGIGDLGEGATAFLDFLVEAGQSIWQMLPIGPVDRALGGSPYCGMSAFAGNELLIDLKEVEELGLLPPGDGTPHWAEIDAPVDWDLVFERKGSVLDKAWERFRSGRADLREEFESFCKMQATWLEEYSLFCALKSSQEGKPWTEWPRDLRLRSPKALEEAAAALKLERERVEFGQWLFFRQWGKFSREAHRRGITLFGDLPIYVGLDSADVWSWQEGFDLGQDGRPVTVAGVPPDYFSPTGQRWGNPTYRWEVHQKDRYAWWRARVKHALSLFDCIRIDHFRGLAAYWSIPATEETALRGKWIEAPGEELLEVLLSEHPNLPIVAEDLGIITQDVERLKRRFCLPGMRVLQFGFSGEIGTNPHAPHNFPQNSVAYTGTHDNNTARGWFMDELTEEGKTLLSRYLGHRVTAESVAYDLIRLAYSSPAAWAVCPLQDGLGLDGRSRMNRPGRKSGNWTWRCRIPDRDLAQNLLEMATLFGRTKRSQSNVINEP